MKKLIFSITMLIGATMIFTSCGAPAANNAANAGNKPANAANAATAPAADKAAVEAEVKKTIDEFAAALNKNDAGAVEKFYTDDYTLIDQNGATHTKASRIESIKSGAVKFEDMKFADVKVKTSPSGDGAVATAHVTGKSTFDGKSETRDSMVTWVLGKMKDKGWQFVNAQITDVKPGAKPADDKKSDDAKKDAAPAANANK